MLIDFFFDFETRSRVDLKKVGTVNYATDPSTEATLLTWCFGKEGSVKYWRMGDEIPAEILHVAINPEKFHFIAHNVLFDFMIWTVTFKRLIPGLKRPPIQNITDNMALTNYNRVGAGLEHSAMMLNLPYSKDKDGRRIMLKQAKPSSVGRNKGEFPILTEEEEASFVRYGIIDTKLLRDVYYRLKLLPATERWGFEWTFKRNLRGVRIDMDLLNTMENMLNTEIPRLSQQFKTLVGGTFEVSQRARCLEYFKKFYPMENMQKETVRETLEEGKHKNPTAHKALKIYAEVNSTSLAKVDVARRMNYNGRIYDIWNFALAHTRRWAGKGIQPQNFPRSGNIKGLEDLNLEDLALEVDKVAKTTDNWCQIVKDLLRRLWLPDENKTFYCGDFSKIEPTVLFWLCDLGPIPKSWYEEMASEIYRVPVCQIGNESEERQVGKGAALGSGYGQGWAGFQKQQKANAGLKLSDDICRQAVDAYRRKYHQVVALWRQLEAGFRSAITGQGVSICRGKVHIMPMDKPLRGVQIRLPSGAYLFYPGASQDSDGLFYKTIYRNQVVKEKLYGGKLTENVVSSIARDIMLSSMFKLEQAGFENLGTVHDEVWSQNVAGQDELYEQTMCKLPTWCNDMLVTVESKNGVRYLK